MRREEFEAYLIGKYGARTRHVQDLVSRAQRINDGMGDLDVAYAADALRERLQVLDYSIEDRHNHRAAPEGLVFSFECTPDTAEWYKRLHEGLDSLREAVSAYAEFKDATDPHLAGEVYLAIRARETDVELLKVDAPCGSVLREQILNWFKAKDMPGDGEAEIDRDQLCAFISGQYVDDFDIGEEVDGERNDILKVFESGVWPNGVKSPWVDKALAVVRMG